MAETGAVFGGEHSAHYYFRDNFRADSGSSPPSSCSSSCALAGVPLSELRKPFERYAASGEINTEVDDPHGRDRAGRRAATPTPTRTASTASPSTSATGGSTCARRTPSRCCGSTSRRPTPADVEAHVAEVADAHRTSTQGALTMALDPQLLEILACPEDKGPLLYFEDEDALYNPRLQAALRASATTSRSC